MAAVVLWLVAVILVTFFFVSPSFVNWANPNASDLDRLTSRGALTVCACFVFALGVTIINYRRICRGRSALKLDIPPQWNPWLTAGFAIILAVVIGTRVVR